MLCLSLQEDNSHSIILNWEQFLSRLLYDATVREYMPYVEVVLPIALATADFG